MGLKGPLRNGPSIHGRACAGLRTLLESQTLVRAKFDFVTSAFAKISSVFGG